MRDPRCEKRALKGLRTRDGIPACVRGCVLLSDVCLCEGRAPLNPTICVQMSTTEEAQRAIEYLTDTEVCGRKVQQMHACIEAQGAKTRTPGAMYSPNTNRHAL